MKNLFKILLGLLFVIPSFAQKGFPVKQDATYFNGIKDSFNASNALKEGGTVRDYSVKSVNQLLSEGRGRIQTYSANNFLTTPGAVTAGSPNTVGGSGIVARPGKRIYITSITIGCSGAALVQAVSNLDAAQNWYSYIGLASASTIFGTTRFTHTFGVNGGSITFEIPSGFVLYENSTLSFTYSSTDTNGRNVSYSVSGVEVPNEPNPNAKFRISIFGDSTAWGANLGNDPQGRAYLGASQWSEVFRDNCRANGVDAQIFANMAEDGKTMLEGWYGLLTGLNRTQYDLAFIDYGMNDAVITKFPTESVFKEAAKAWILERNKYNPGKPLVFMSPAATDAPDRIGSGRIASIRTWIRDVAFDTTIGGAINKVYYFDQSLNIPLNSDQTLDLNYKDSERTPTATYRIHYSGAGSTKTGNDLWSYLKTPLFNK